MNTTQGHKLALNLSRMPAVSHQGSSQMRGYSLWPETLVIFAMPFLLTISGFREIRYISHLIAGALLYSVFRLWILDGLSARSKRLQVNTWPHDQSSLYLAIAYSIWSSLAFFFGIFFGVVSFTGAWVDILAYLALFYFPFVVQKFGVRDNNGVSRLLDVVLLSMLIYLASNFALWLADVRPLASSQIILGENRLLRLVGIATSRVNFPISSGLNGMAVMGACSIAVALASWQRGASLRRFAAAALLLAGLAVVVLSDSRGVLLATLMVFLVFMLRTSRLMIASIPWLYIALTLIPVFVLTLAALIPESLIFSVLDRGNTQFRTPIAALTTGRSYVWESVGKIFDPITWNTLFGFGHYGHVVSGVSKEYSWIFGDGNSYSLHTTHSALAQMLIDRGVLGCGLLICLLFVLGRRLALSWTLLNFNVRSQPDVLAAILILVALTVSAGTEAVLSTYFRDSIFLLGVSVAIAVSTNAGNYSLAISPSQARLRKTKRTFPSAAFSGLRAQRSNELP